MVKFFYVQLHELAIRIFVDVAEPKVEGIFKRMLLTLSVSLFYTLIRRHDENDGKLSYHLPCGVIIGKTSVFLPI